MSHDQVITLLTVSNTSDENSNFDPSPSDPDAKQVFVSVASVRMSEFYASANTDFKPEIVFKLSDSRDYNGERFCVFNGIQYEIIRTFDPMNGNDFEIYAGRIDHHGYPLPS